MNLFSQYRGFRRELYILFWGRVVTNMGALIWPMLTLILTNKLGFSPSHASTLILLVGFFMLPATLIGGRLADRMDKRKLIVCCDLITVAGYLACGLLPMTWFSVVCFSVAGVFAQLEWPSFDALVANLSTPEQRERAYSFNNLGSNLGLVLAPTLGGLLFENHLDLAFIISGVATLSSTVLIFFFVKDTHRSKGEKASGVYEEESDISVRQVFSGNPVLVFFMVCIGLGMAMHTVSLNFLMPLNMDHFFGTRGAMLLGTLTSINAVAVLIGTPFFTSLLSGIRDVTKLQLGVLLQMLGYGLFMFARDSLVSYFLSILVFTCGQVLMSLGDQPYISRRVPASHRGRMSAIRSTGQMTLQGAFLLGAGQVADFLPMGAIWLGMVIVGFLNFLVIFWLRRLDKKQFSLFYSRKK